MNTIDKLTEQLSKFPGIGPRQAKRFVYFLLTRDNYFLEELAKNILSLKKNVQVCESCYRFFNLEPRVPNRKCDICLGQNRDNSVLMVVGKDTDLENIEKNNVYNGKYFVLGGYLPILNKRNGWKIRDEELINLVKKSNDLEEIILALSLNPEGENTIHHLIQLLKPITSINITTLGKGLSTGTELEYSDDDTLKNALKNRG